MSDMTGPAMTCDAFADRLADHLEGDLPEGMREQMQAHADGCDSCGALLAELLMIARDAAALPALEPSRDLWQGVAARINAPVLPLDAGRTVDIRPLSRRGWVRPSVAAAALVLFTASVTHVLTRASLAPVPPASSAPVRTASTTPATPAVEPEVKSAPADSSTGARAAGSAGPREARLSSTSTVARRQLASVAARTTRAASPDRPSSAAGTVRLVNLSPLGEAEPVYDREIVALRRIVRERRAQLDPHTIAVLEQSVAVIDSAIAQSRAALAKDPASGLLATQLNYSLEKKVELLRMAALLPART